MSTRDDDGRKPDAPPSAPPKPGRSLDHDEIPNILTMVLREVRLLREMFGEMTEHGGALGFGGDHDPGVNDDHDE